VGARFDGAHTGTVGDAGAFSFYPVKHLTTAEGGMFVTRHAEVARRVRRLRGFGIDRTHDERTTPGMYDVPGLGLNYRMSELQAALGRAQLGRAGEMLVRRAANAAALRRGLGDTPGVRVVEARDPRAEQSHYCTNVVLTGDLAARRDEVIARLNARGVGTSIYYPQPVPRMAYYRARHGDDAGAAFPHATELSDASVALPVGPHVVEAEAVHIGRSVAHVVRELHCA